MVPVDFFYFMKSYLHNNDVMHRNRDLIHDVTLNHKLIERQYKIESLNIIIMKCSQLMLI